VYIILSQRKDLELSYSDDLYKIYHFPARYKNQISTGDIFVYYQGDRYDRAHRVYFGTGVVGRIYTTDGESYYAELHSCSSFEKEVPIYLENNGRYIEQLGYNTVRKSPNPPWQSSIRPLSEMAYKHIVSHAGDMFKINNSLKEDDLKADLKNAIKGYYLGGDRASLKTIVDIANQILDGTNCNGIPCSAEEQRSKGSPQALIDYCRSMKMSYSYKPVLILSLIRSEKLSITLSEAVDYFRKFYEERRRNGQKIEKKNCIYQRPNTSDEMIADNILANPIKALLKSGYFEYVPNSQEFRIVKSIAEQITKNEISVLESFCRQKLQAYFSSLGK